MATNAVSTAGEALDESILGMIANHLYHNFSSSRVHYRFSPSSNPLGLIVRIFAGPSKCYVTCCYFGMKALFICNILLQLSILHFFLDLPNDNPPLWGFTLFLRLMKGNEWQDTGIFPRVTMCDFEIRELGNIHRWSVQCVLPLNMFNEKVYILLWFWLNVLLAVTVISALLWVFKITLDSNRKHFVKNMISTAWVMNHLPPDTMEDDKIECLVENLGWDGVLVLHLLCANAGELCCIGVTKQLYDRVPSPNANGL
ncbi:hypothetical protein AB6A40_007289 [Gnathostoma spinigerum]|uniref:Innexin n=1 Tax=Gnathostoma spinigerum TaxID=75299 RepID=A0ABD6EWE5_9BILA